MIAVLVLKTYIDKNNKLRGILYNLVVDADSYLDTNTGKEKKQLVIDWFYKRYKFLGLIVTEEELGTLIDEEAEKLKVYLAEKDKA